jgi:hypothetical protein
MFIKGLAVAFFFFSQVLLAQDTVWIDCPRLVNLRKTSEERMNKCVEASGILHNALLRIWHTPEKKSASEEVTPLDDILSDEKTEIVLTSSTKKAYIKEIQSQFVFLKDQYDAAQESIELCDYLNTLRQFYIRDYPITYYYNHLPQKEIDSLYELYLEQNSPKGEGMYYFDDWLWLKLHHKLPEDRTAAPKKEPGARISLG